MADKKKYDADYTEKHLKRIPLNVQKTQYEVIEKAAAEAGEKVSVFIKRAVISRLTALGYEWPLPTGKPGRPKKE